MTHEQALERLDDFACGELPDIERVRVQRHVDTCAECQAEVDTILALLAEAAALPKTIAPPRDLWAGIALRLEPRAEVLAVTERDTKVIPLAPRRRHWQPPRWALQIAAALVLMVGTSFATAKILSDRQPGRPTGPIATLDPSVVTAPRGGTQQPVTGGGTGGTAPTVRSTPAQTPTAFAAFRPAERDYQSAIGDLQRVLDQKSGQMAPETVQTLERNLRIIDAAIAESRAALVKDPNSRELIEMLSATYDTKVKVLRQAVEL